MDSSLDQTIAIHLAVTQASLLVSAGALPERLADTPVHGTATPVHDINGDVIMWRVPLATERGGYLDVGADLRVGAPLIALAPEAEWAPGRYLEAATAALPPGTDFDHARFVAYSFPKLAVQFLRDGREVAMLELHTWQAVPETRPRARNASDNFIRWSYFDAMPARTRAARIRRYEREIGDLTEILDQILVDRIAIRNLDVSAILQRNRSRELHYSTRDADHHVCYELRGQETNVWCVGASVQMLLDFYRYQYTQVRLAQELGLGTLANPQGLPYADDALVVDVIEKLTSSALDATMFTSNSFGRFIQEINANRPLISFIPGHSRTVAGYTDVTWLRYAPFRGLLVFDPWPPNAGVITRWENFDTQTYRRAFTATLTLV